MKLFPLLTLAFLALALPARAQTVTPNPAPTIITTAPYTINTPGYYQLGKDLTYFGTGATNDAIITINASNVTLDFGGHYISGPSNNAATQLHGVYANEKGNLNIRNGTIAFCFDGVFLTGNTSSSTLNINQRIENLLVTHCYSYGVYLYGANYSAIANNRFTFTGGSTYNPEAGAIFLGGKGIADEASDNFITNVTAATNANAYGIYNGGSLSAYRNRITNVTISSSSSTNYLPYGIYNASFGVGGAPPPSIALVYAYADSNVILNIVGGTGIANAAYRNNVVIGAATGYSGSYDYGNNK